MKMIGRRKGGMVIVALLGTSLSGGASAQVAGSVEDGLAGLAKQIVQKSTAADRSTIAVLPFPHADGSCSVLSTYIVDELILSLFSVPDSKLELVERAQLEALLDEIQLGQGGLLNPETTKKLGTQSGVSALTVGTITVIGDTIRLNARLVATDTGKTISAAAVTIPKTQAVSDLLGRPMASGPTCGGTATRSAAQPTAAAASGRSASTNKPGSAAAPPQAVLDTDAQMIVSGIRGTDVSVGKNKSGKNLTVALMVENVSDREMRLALIGPSPIATDNEGTSYEMRLFSGAGQCSQLTSGYIAYCLENNGNVLPMNAYSILNSGARTTLNFAFSSNEESQGDVVSFSAHFALLSAKAGDGDAGTGSTKENDAETIKSRFEQSTIGFGIPNIQLKTRQEG